MRLSYSPQALVGACSQAVFSGPFQQPRNMPTAAHAHPLRNPPQRQLAPIHRRVIKPRILDAHLPTHALKLIPRFLRGQANTTVSLTLLRLVGRLVKPPDELVRIFASNIHAAEHPRRKPDWSRVRRWAFDVRRWTATAGGGPGAQRRRVPLPS